MTKRFFTLAATLLAGFLTMMPAASAATFNFQAIADAPPGEYGAPSIVFNDASGIQLTATGRSLDGNSTYNAYLDSGNAGLGVCQNLNGSNQCSPSSDDNVTLNEVVELAFNQLVQVTSITFRDGDHGTTFRNDTLAGFAFGTGDTLLTAFTGFDPDVPTNMYNSSLMSLQIIAASTFQGLNPDRADLQLYISSITVEAVRDVPEVPEPGTIGLLGLGLVGLATRARRKRK